MDRLYWERTGCRACGGKFDGLLDLGKPVLSDFVAPDEGDPPSAPLDVVVCQTCELVQLRHTVNPEQLYRKYWYQSGINETMRAELADIVRTADNYVPPRKLGRVVLDIGANDGTLLSNYFLTDRRIAIEPARNISPSEHANVVINDFFPHATEGLSDRSVDIITSIACFYDLDEPLAFVAEIDRLLSTDGVWIVQFQDLGQMVQATAFDNICHEHLCYYSATTLNRLLADFDLRIVDGENRRINGGSLRFILQRNSPNKKKVNWIDVQGVYEERTLGRDTLDHFAWRVGQYKDQLLGVLDRVRHDHPVDMYGASTKASTLLQYCGLNSGWIRQAVERTPEKWGMETSGTRIPIIAEGDWRVDPAPVSLLPIWQFKDAILKREADYLARGGAFIVPLPVPEVICARGL